MRVPTPIGQTQTEQQTVWRAYESRDKRKTGRQFVCLFICTNTLRTQAQIEPTKAKNELRCVVADRGRQKKLFENSSNHWTNKCNICTVTQHYAPNASEPHWNNGAEAVPKKNQSKQCVRFGRKRAEWDGSQMAKTVKRSDKLWPGGFSSCFFAILSAADHIASLFLASSTESFEFLRCFFFRFFYPFFYVCSAVAVAAKKINNEKLSAISILLSAI